MCNRKGSICKLRTLNAFRVRMLCSISLYKFYTSSCCINFFCYYTWKGVVWKTLIQHVYVNYL